jgi:bla regulator protein BlaR1
MEAILTNLTKAIGWSIFHSLWQGAAIYGLLLLVLFAMPKTNARLRHNLAYGAMCLMFAAFVTSFLMLFKFPGESTNPVLTQGVLYGQYLADLPLSLSKQAERFFPYIVTVYTIGLAIQLGMLSAGYRKLQKLKQSQQELVPGTWTTLFNKLTAQLNLRQHIGFALSDKINVPLVIGYFKPVILFPIALVNQLDLKQVEAILIHELSHIRRNDYLLNLVKTAIETILFFNPFIWLGSRLINIEREHACDDMVLKLTETPLTYAHALLKLEILQDNSSPAFAMAASGKAQHLYQRIKRITDMKTNYINAKQRIFAITLTIATVISLAWVKPAKTEEKVKIVHPAITSLKTADLKIEDLKNQSKVHLAAQVCEDTTKKKKKFNILMVDDKGNKHEYNSMAEMPDSLKKEVISKTFSNTNNLRIHIDSIVGTSLAFLHSPEWKAQIQQVNDQITQQFSSEDWKKTSAELQKSSEELRKNGEELKKSASQMKYFQSKEWLKAQKEIRKESEKMMKKVNSDKFRQAIANSARMEIFINNRTDYANSRKIANEKRQELESSKEYQDLKKKFDAEVEAIRKRKETEADSLKH